MANCPTENCPYGEMSHGKLSHGKKSHGEKLLSRFQETRWYTFLLPNRKIIGRSDFEIRDWNPGFLGKCSLRTNTVDASEKYHMLNFIFHRWKIRESKPGSICIGDQGFESRVLNGKA